MASSRLSEVNLKLSNSDIDELLVEWEFSRQQGTELSVAELCQGREDLVPLLEQQIAILQKTSWMLQDPAPAPYQADVLSSVSNATLSEQAIENTRRSDVVSLDRQALSLHAIDSIPGFKLLHVLGRGGFGIVYRALDLKLAREVAIKLPLADDPPYRERYINEARKAASVEVPGIVPILQVGHTQSGVPFVVQKLIDGHSLAKLLARENQLDALRVIRFLSEVCTAVGTAHAKSLFHRDLKPANILFDLHGRSWITDFGLSVTEEEQELYHGEVAGTPSYMSPEQLLGRVDWLDGRTDIWAIGVILYQSLTGKLPFAAQNRAELRSQILNREPRPICQRRPDLDKQWDVIFQRCCAKHVRDRYDTAFDLASDLRTLHSKLSLGNSIPLSYEEHLNASTQANSASNSAVGTELAQTAYKSKRWVFVTALLLSGTLIASIALNNWKSHRVISQQISNENEDPSEIHAKQQPEIPEVFSVAIGSAFKTDPNSFDSIQAAVDAAKDGQIILLPAGHYTESVRVAKRIKLRTDGPENSVTITGKTGPAFTIGNPGILSITGITIATDSPPDVLSNAIDVQGGSLILEQCNLKSTEFDCVRLAPESSLLAENCNFYSARHPAVYAKRVQRLTISGCHFFLEPDADSPSNEFLVGIQATQSGGSISDCTFDGGNATGIEWRDSQLTTLISDCNFANLTRGIAAHGCEDIRISGQIRTVTTACKTGIEINASGGWIKNCEIDGRQVENSIGIQVLTNGQLVDQKSESFELESCSISGTEVALAMSQARVKATLLTITDCRGTAVHCLDNSSLSASELNIHRSHDIGLLVRSSQAVLERCQFMHNATAGIVIDSLEESLMCKGCMLVGNPVGIILLSGSATLHDTHIRDNDTGVLLARRHELLLPPTCDALLGLNCQGGSIEARRNVVHFLSPGKYHMQACIMRDPAAGKPFLGAGLVEVIKENYTSVEALP